MALPGGSNLPDAKLAPGLSALDLIAQRRATTSAYALERGQETYNILLYGKFGTGKTTLASTGRGPFYWYVWDPGGTKLAKLDELESKGMLIRDTLYERETSAAPYAFEQFDKVHGEMKRANAYAHFGTVVIDSLTSFAPAIMNYILKKAGRTNTVPQIADYLTLSNILQQVVKEFCDLPCDFILIGHSEGERDELTGRLETSLLVQGRSKGILPTLFDEVLMPVAMTATGKRPEYKVQIYSDSKTNCSTRRFSGPQFDVFETPDLRALYKKAGRASIDDLPPLTAVAD